MLSRPFGQFAIELRDHRRFVLAGHHLQAARVFDGLVPVALVLVDRNQMAQCRRRMGVHRHQVGKQRLGTIKQAGAHVVLAQLQQGHGLHRVGQARARDQVLVQADGAIHLTAPAEQVAQRQMRFDRVAVVFGQLEEDLDAPCPAPR